MPSETSSEQPATNHPYNNVWANWLDSTKWRQQLERRVLHKALDIPEDDGTKVTQVSGVGWKEILAAGAVLTGMGYVASGLIGGADTPTPPAVTAPTVDTDTDTGITGIGRRPADAEGDVQQ